MAKLDPSEEVQPVPVDGAFSGPQPKKPVHVLHLPLGGMVNARPTISHTEKYRKADTVIFCPRKHLRGQESPLARQTTAGGGGGMQRFFTHHYVTLD
jgi:hypothetical protein